MLFFVCSFVSFRGCVIYKVVIKHSFLQVFRSLIPPTEDENNCIYYDQFKGIQNSPMQSKNLPDCFTGKCHRCLSGIVYLFVLLIYFNSSYSVTKGYECVNKIIPAFGKLQHEPLLITLIELSKPERRMF